SGGGAAQGRPVAGVFRSFPRDARGAAAADAGGGGRARPGDCRAGDHLANRRGGAPAGPPARAQTQERGEPQRLNGYSVTQWKPRLTSRNWFRSTFSRTTETHPLSEARAKGCFS